MEPRDLKYVACHWHSLHHKYNYSPRSKRACSERAVCLASRISACSFLEGHWFIQLPSGHCPTFPSKTPVHWEVNQLNGCRWELRDIQTYRDSKYSDHVNWSPAPAASQSHAGCWFFSKFINSVPCFQICRQCTSLGPRQYTAQVWIRSDEQMSRYVNDIHTNTHKQRPFTLVVDC